MMNRDLLVVAKKYSFSEFDIQKTILDLNKVLIEAESFRIFCVANEIIDLNRYKIITKPFLVATFIRDKSLRPFIFINNKN